MSYGYAFLIGLLVIAPGAQANEQQRAADALIYQQQRDQLLDSQQRPMPQATVPLDGLLQPVTPVITDEEPDQGLCFTVNRIVLVGEDAEKFNWALHSVTRKTAGYIGECLTVANINDLLSIVQNEIIKKGFVTTRVLLPAQNLSSGLLTIEVIPGKINDVRGDAASRSFWQWNTVPMSSGDLLNIRDLEQALENIQRLPTVDADFQIKPAHGVNKPGYSDIEIRHQQQRRYRLSASTDDSGSRATGKQQGNVTLSLDNITNNHDLLYVSYNRNLSPLKDASRGTEGYNVNYTIPYKYWLINASTSRFDYHQTIAGANQPYVYAGESINNAVTISNLVYRDAMQKVTLSAGAYHRRSRNYIDDTEVEVQRRRTSGWQAGIVHQLKYKQHSLDWGLNYFRGVGMLGATRSPGELFDEEDSRAGFWRGSVGYQTPFVIRHHQLQYSANFRFQQSGSILTPQDRFSIGNRYTVRGFDGEQSLAGESGMTLRQEVAAALPWPKQQVYLAADYGRVSGRATERSHPLVGHKLAGTALGYRGAVSAVQYDVFIATPIYHPTGFKASSLTSGMSLYWSY
ncbi:MAG: ShlB/FhaC/HecB family hemolysin secretion/activation protein [Moraxellaceae bacterium]|nr:ShlB/FhaC/HecB family hemolysin secretion/activation protein [Moraxellaceae bacterium]